MYAALSALPVSFSFIIVVQNNAPGISPRVRNNALLGVADLRALNVVMLQGHPRALNSPAAAAEQPDLLGLNFRLKSRKAVRARHAK